MGILRLNFSWTYVRIKEFTPRYTINVLAKINKEYRNQGIGSCVFPLILETFEGYLQIGFSCIILKAFSLEYIGKYYEVDDELNIENCNISYKDENNVTLNNILFENITIEDSGEYW